jgi:tetratricopeptide (TPR) repeat protein
VSTLCRAILMTDRSALVLLDSQSEQPVDRKPHIVRPETDKFLADLEAALPDDAAARLFQVWGVGGVGKSTVLLQARKRLAGRVLAAEVSFGVTDGIEGPIGLMEVLAKQLPNGGWGSDFGELIKLYRETQRELKDQPIEKGMTEEDKKSGLQVVLNIGLGTVKGFLPDDVAKDVDELKGKIVDGGTTAILGAAAWLKQHRATKKNKELRDLLLNPEPRLTKAFARLLRGLGQPVLLVLDTYEKATQEVDGWLWRTLLANQDVGSEGLGGTRILVAGRNSLVDELEGWRRLQQDRGCVRGLGLDRFDLLQTQKYLQACGIADDGAIEQIYSQTKGLPYYLNWIREEVQAGRKPDFSRGNESIVDLLLQGLTREQRRLIEIAACFRRFKRKNIERILEKLKIEHNVEFAAAEQGYFDWLTDRSQTQFIEPHEDQYRLDDVARDVFRRSLFEEDENLFRIIQGLISADYLTESQKIEPENSEYCKKYENRDWRKKRSAYLYHLLLSADRSAALIFRNHFLESRYFQMDELVQVVLKDLAEEFGLDQHPILDWRVKQFLDQIRPAIEHGEIVLDKIPLNYNHPQIKKYSRSQIDLAIQTCLGEPEKLTGLAHFIALLYKAGRCPDKASISCIQQAMRTAEKLVVNAVNPEFSSGLFTWGLGNRLAELGKYESAIASYERALKLWPNFYQAWYNRGISLGELAVLAESQGKSVGELDCLLEEEIRSYQEAVEINPGFDQAWYNLGVALKDVDLETALACYDKALDIQPNKAEAWDSKGIALKRLGQAEKAVGCYESALSIKPDYYQAWYNMGVALGSLGQYDIAIVCFKQAVDYNPEYAKAFYNLACVNALLTNIDQALFYLGKAIDLCPNLYIDKARSDIDLEAIHSTPEFEYFLTGKVS